jgi:hypothetical protein
MSLSAKYSASICEKAHYKVKSICYHTVNGTWPSGKAPGFGPGIRGFESLRPSQELNDIV